MNINACRYLELYRDIMRFGTLRSPRGQLCRDLMNGHVVFDLNDTPCTSFQARKFNLTYAKKELLWYIDADPKSDWIENFATAWKKLKQPDGTFYSNYGQYLFSLDFAGDPDCGSQFEYVVETLKADRDSRRACMVLLQPYHLFSSNIDTVCTYAIQFAIYDNTLNMTVMMRSNDAIWGLSNDVFCFWNIGQMVYSLLKETYPDLERGTYTHVANSLHIYERHFQMVTDIIDQDLSGYNRIEVPYVTADETRDLLKLKGPQSTGPFIRWLTDRDR